MRLMWPTIFSQRKSCQTPEVSTQKPINFLILFYGHVYPQDRIFKELLKLYYVCLLSIMIQNLAMNFKLDLDCIKSKVGSLNWYILTGYLPSQQLVFQKCCGKINQFIQLQLSQPKLNWSLNNIFRLQILFFLSPKQIFNLFFIQVANIKIGNTTGCKY